MLRILLGCELLSYPLPVGESPGLVVRFEWGLARFLCRLGPGGGVLLGGRYWLSPPLLR